MQHENIFLLSFHFMTVLNQKSQFQSMLPDGSLCFRRKKPYKKWNSTENDVLYGSFHFLMQEIGLSKKGSFLETVLWKTLIWFTCNTDLFPIGHQHES